MTRQLTIVLWISCFLLASSSLWAQDETETAEPDATEVPAELPGTTTDTSNTEVDSADETNYELRLAELEDRVNDLKEEIFRSKSRLFLLRQQILQDNIGGSRIVITHNNLMGSMYRLSRVVYALDGNQIYAATDDDTRIDDSFEVYRSAAVAGPHNLSVEMEFEGNGYGIFSYMSGYEFTLLDSHAFDVDEGQTVIVDTIAYEEGGVNNPIEERPQIRFEMDMTDTTEDMTEGEDD